MNKWVLSMKRRHCWPGKSLRKPGRGGRSDLGVCCAAPNPQGAFACWPLKTRKHFCAEQPSCGEVRPLGTQHLPTFSSTARPPGRLRNRPTARGPAEGRSRREALPRGPEPSAHSVPLPWTPLSHPEKEVCSLEWGGRQRFGEEAESPPIRTDNVLGGFEWPFVPCQHFNCCINKTAQAHCPLPR